MLKNINNMIHLPIMDSSYSYGKYIPINHYGLMGKYIFTHIEKTYANMIVSDATIISIDHDNNEVSVPVKALWDTGATITCISRELVEKYNLITGHNQKSIHSFNHSDMTDLTSACIALDNIPQAFCLYIPIFEKNNCPYDLIIGNDIILQGDLTIKPRYSQTTLTFEYMVFENEEERHAYFTNLFNIENKQKIQESIVDR